MGRRIFIFLSLLGALLGFICVGEARAVVLQYNHTAGESLDYSLDVDQEEQDMSVDVNRHVDDVDGSGIITITTSFSNGVIVKPNNREIPLEISGPVSLTTMDNSGVVSGVEFLGEADDLASSTGSIISLTQDMMTSLGIPDFPAEDLSVDDTWTRTISGTTACEFTYTLEAIDDTSQSGYTCARIGISADPVISVFQEVPEARMSVTIKGTESIRGTLLFDINDGKIVRLDETISADAVSTMQYYNGEVKVIPKKGDVNITLVIE